MTFLMYYCYVLLLCTLYISDNSVFSVVRVYYVQLAIVVSPFHIMHSIAHSCMSGVPEMRDMYDMT